jgi:hypothetical protein
VALPPDVLEEILERTDGVPLFLEEVTKVVMEATGSRDAVATIPGPRTAVPATLQASLLARLDRFGAAAREIAQTGAAIGREFSHEVIVAVSPRIEPETSAALDHLVSAGLVFQRGTPPDADYQFKHALVQDAAYGTLLLRPGGHHVRRPRRRVRAERRGVQQSRASLHAGAAACGAGGGGAGRTARADSGHAARFVCAGRRMQLPPALPARRFDVRTDAPGNAPAT